MRRGAAGYGRSFGSAVHAAIEVLNRRGLEELSDDYLERILEEHLSGRITRDHVLQTRRMLEGLTSSALWQGMKRAQRVLPEVPVATYVTDSENKDGLGSKPERQLVRGVIDLAFRTEDGWTLVDFKTDRVPDPVVLDALTDQYTPQIKAYTCYWAAQTHAEVHRAGLWFADPGEFVPV